MTALDRAVASAREVVVSLEAELRSLEPWAATHAAANFNAWEAWYAVQRAREELELLIHLAEHARGVFNAWENPKDRA